MYTGLYQRGGENEKRERGEKSVESLGAEKQRGAADGGEKVNEKTETWERGARSGRASEGVGSAPATKGSRQEK